MKTFIAGESGIRLTNFLKINNAMQCPQARLRKYYRSEEYMKTLPAASPRQLGLYGKQAKVILSVQNREKVLLLILLLYTY